MPPRVKATQRNRNSFHCMSYFILVTHSDPTSDNIPTALPRHLFTRKAYYSTIEMRTDLLSLVVSINVCQLISFSLAARMPDGHQILSRRKRAVTDLMSAENKTALLDLHNQLRRQEVELEGAADMEYMHWHDGLATQAKAWADQCDFVHGGHGAYTGSSAEDTWSSVGQNLGWNSHNTDPLNALKDWYYTEKSHFNYDTLGCAPGQICGHYTQVVWAQSKYLGCAYVQCQPITDSDVGKTWANGYYLVCHYGPPGNLQATKPFKKDSNCTRCNSGSFQCDNGLCRDCITDGVDNCECKGQCQNCGTLNQASCTCSCYQGYEGGYCQNECQNNHGNCGSGWYASHCDFDVGTGTLVHEYCPLMCQKCSTPDGTCVPTTSTSTAATQPTDAPTTGATDTTTTASSNNGDCSTAITCSNGGTPDSPSAVCTCACTTDWQGDRCQFHKGEHGKGVVLSIAISGGAVWADIWSELKPVIAVSVDSECGKTSDACDCSSSAGYAQNIVTGQGYPHQPDGSANLKALVFVDSTSCSSPNQVPVSQDILHDAIVNAQSNITDTLNDCCNTKLAGVEKGVVDSGSTRWQSSIYTWAAMLFALFLVS